MALGRLHPLVLGEILTARDRNSAELGRSGMGAIRMASGAYASDGEPGLADRAMGTECRIWWRRHAYARGLGVG